MSIMYQKQLKVMLGLFILEHFSMLHAVSLLLRLDDNYDALT